MILNIEKSIKGVNLNAEAMQELLNAVEEAKLKYSLKSSNNLVIDIAKNFANKYPVLIESSSIIPQILMQKNCKTIDFLINSQVFGIYCILAIFIFINFGVPFLNFVWSINEPYLANRAYASLLIMFAQLAYYRFLWKKLMP